jgi:predicted nucleotidyltransferase
MILQYHSHVDVSKPANVLAGGLIMPVLRALSSRASPATAAQLRRAAAAGTEAGVRRALDRLAGQGLLATEEIGGRVVYLLNRDHVLYPAVTALLRAEDELPRRLRGEIPAWIVPPVAAALYGSAARRDGDADSDIDILLVRPASLGSRERELWNDQVYRLRDLVQRWTGNRCQVTDRSVAALRRLSRAREPIVDEWRKDAVSLAGADISQLLGQA